MGWFDDERNTTGSLTTRLAEDAAHVQGVSEMLKILCIIQVNHVILFRLLGRV